MNTLRFSLFAASLILLALGEQGLYGQNLVPNPSFEKLKSSPSCWTSGSREEFENQVQDWFLPNNGTTDLFSTQLMPSCITSMPYSSHPIVSWYPGGSQMPRTGENLAGIKPLFEQRREYLEVKLTCPLVPGQEYYCEMYVSLSERTNYAQNALGMYFSDTLIYINDTKRLKYTPQIVESSIIDDTINWVRISGTFIASSPAQYLLLGNFAKEFDTQLKDLGNKGDIDFTYYYIDDVLVRPVQPYPLLVEGDTTVCKNDTLLLKATGWNNIQWYASPATYLASGTSLTYLPSSSIKIKITGNHCNWNLTREVEIVVNPPLLVNLGKDTLICEGTSIVLNAGPGQDYEWQDGSASAAMIISQPGLYKVKVSDSEGCEGKDEIIIDFYKTPAPSLGPDLITCKPNGTLDVTTGQPYDIYSWQNKTTLPTFDYAEEGTYWVKVTNICGIEITDTLVVKKIDPFVPNLITPNGDGKNDVFEILQVEKGKGLLQIFNRYGSQLYSNNYYSHDWPGKELPEGVYFYKFTYPTCPEIKGWVEIIR